MSIKIKLLIGVLVASTYVGTFMAGSAYGFNKSVTYMSDMASSKLQEAGDKIMDVSKDELVKDVSDRLLGLLEKSQEEEDADE